MNMSCPATTQLTDVSEQYPNTVGPKRAQVVRNRPKQPLS
jgi:hypothetical protein